MSKSRMQELAGIPEEEEIKLNEFLFVYDGHDDIVGEVARRTVIEFLLLNEANTLELPVATTITFKSAKKLPYYLNDAKNINSLNGIFYIIIQKIPDRFYIRPNPNDSLQTGFKDSLIAVRKKIALESSKNNSSEPNS